MVSRKLNKGKMDFSPRKGVINWKRFFEISNAQKSEMTNVSSRHGKIKRKPDIICDCNESTFCIDRSNKMLLYHSALRKTLRWYKKVSVDLLKLFLTIVVYLYKRLQSIIYLNFEKSLLKAWLINEK